MKRELEDFLLTLAHILSLGDQNSHVLHQYVYLLDLIPRRNLNVCYA